MTPEEIDALRSQVDDLSQQLAAAKERLRQALIEAAPVKVGDIVRSRGDEFRVVEVDPAFGRPWVRGNPRKKDGTFGNAIRALYSDWELVTPTSTN